MDPPGRELRGTDLSPTTTLDDRWTFPERCSPPAATTQQTGGLQGEPPVVPQPDHPWALGDQINLLPDRSGGRDLQLGAADGRAGRQRAAAAGLLGFVIALAVVVVATTVVVA
jgi:hypothetical protein